MLSSTNPMTHVVIDFSMGKKTIYHGAPWGFSHNQA
jgi:hypothetical protein